MKGILSYIAETGRKEVGSADLAMAIANNGFKILAKPKYATIIGEVLSYGEAVAKFKK